MIRLLRFLFVPGERVVETVPAGFMTEREIRAWAIGVLVVGCAVIWATGL